MHIHYFALKRIAEDLHRRAAGGILGEAFTQDRDQLVIGLGAPTEDIWLRVSCGAPIPYLWPSSQFNKARKNVKSMFTSLLGLGLLRIHAIPNERVIVIDLEQGHQLALKMHGLQSNVLHLHHGVVVERFRQNADSDLEFQIRDGEWNANAITDPDMVGMPVAERLRAVSPMLDKHFAPVVEQAMQHGLDFQAALAQAIQAAEDDTLHLLRRHDRIQLLLLAGADAPTIHIQGFHNALNIFLRTFHQYQGYARLYEEVRKPLDRHLQRLHGQIDSFCTSIDTIANERPPEEIGHILMAQLHLVTQGMEEIELMDIYHNTPIKIKLKPDLNPQQNAEQFYQKQKKHRARVKHLEEQIERLDQELSQFDAAAKAFRELPLPQDLNLTADGLDSIVLRRMNAFATEYLPLVQTGKTANPAQKHGFIEMQKDGYTILIGKNAKQNDALTFGYARKDDLWLHARDVTGSHVIIRNPTLGPIPNGVLEYAAAAAARHSKRRHESLVPVQYTERKYVRKVKQGAPGQVIVEREKVVMVEPLPVGQT